MPMVNTRILLLPQMSECIDPLCHFVRRAGTVAAHEAVTDDVGTGPHDAGDGDLRIGVYRRTPWPEAQFS